MIGVTDAVFEGVYKSQWKSKLQKDEFPFNFFRTRFWNSAWYVTVNESDPLSEYGNDQSITPDSVTIVQGVKDSTAVSRIQRDIGV